MMALRNLTPRVDLSPRKLTQQSTKALLKIVPDLSVDSAPGTSKAFVGFIMGIFGIGFAALLTINTLLTQDAIKIQSLKIESLAINENREAIIKEVEKLASPEELAAAAIALRMRPAQSPQFLNLGVSNKPAELAIKP